MTRLRPRSTLFPYTTLFRSQLALTGTRQEIAARLVFADGFDAAGHDDLAVDLQPGKQHADPGVGLHLPGDRKSTRLNSSHVAISYAVFCLKKKTTAT